MHIPLPGSFSRPAHPPCQLGGYTLTRRQVGKGSQGTIYEASHPARGVVAVKGSRRHRDGRDTRAAKDALRTEWLVMARLDHRHVLKVYDWFESGSLGYLVMDYMPGGTLTKKIEDRILGAAEKIVIFRQLCEAVRYLHNHNVCHRDIKPSNVLFDRHGEPVLSDFGLAHLGLDCRNTAGTLRCLAPEVYDLIRSGAPEVRYDGAAADVWCLGITLFAMLVGTFPQALADRGWGDGAGRGATLYERIAIYGPPALPSPDPAAALVLKRMLALKPQQRWKIEQVLDSSYVDEKRAALVQQHEAWDAHPALLTYRHEPGAAGAGRCARDRKAPAHARPAAAPARIARALSFRQSPK